LSVTYQTSPENLQQIPHIIRAAIESQALTRFDRAHFTKFSPSSLDFEAVYYVLAPEMGTYMDIQQAINFVLLDQFASHKIKFAHPTQTVYLEAGGTLPAADADAGYPDGQS
jgi:small-conductance mechanosensitive channel